MIHLRDLLDADGGSCDWGHCDDEAVAARFAADLNMWLPVCHRHAGQAPCRPHVTGSSGSPATRGRVVPTVGDHATTGDLRQCGTMTTPTAQPAGDRNDGQLDPAELRSVTANADRVSVARVFGNAMVTSVGPAATYRVDPPLTLMGGGTVVALHDGERVRAVAAYDPDGNLVGSRDVTPGRRGGGRGWERDASPDDLARIAYAAYGQATGGRNYRGEPMPDWVDLGDTIRGAWLAASHAVVNAFIAEMNDAARGGSS